MKSKIKWGYTWLFSLIACILTAYCIYKGMEGTATVGMGVLGAGLAANFGNGYVKSKYYREELNTNK